MKLVQNQTAFDIKENCYYVYGGDYMDKAYKVLNRRNFNQPAEKNNR